MKKTFAFVAVMTAFAAFAEIAAVRLAGGENAGPVGRALALRATSAATNGTVSVKRVTRYSARRTETATVTNTTYTFFREPYQAFMSNIVTTATVTNIANGVTNVVTTATTNAVYEAAVRVTTNAVFAVETLRVPTSTTLAWTNAIWAATLSDGLAWTNLTDVAIMPGDVLDVSGTAFDDGKGEATILIER